MAGLMGVCGRQTASPLAQIPSQDACKLALHCLPLARGNARVKADQSQKASGLEAR